MIRGWKTSLDTSGVLRKESDDNSWNAGALLQVPDTENFEATFTLCPLNESAGALCAFFAGIAEADAMMPRNDATVKGFIVANPLACLVGSRGFEQRDPLPMRSSRSASMISTETTLGTSLMKGESLTVRCTGSKLVFFRGERTFEAPALPPGSYRPCVILGMPRGAVAVRVSRKRPPDQAADDRSLRLWHGRKFHDALVRCGGREFPVHRAILCAGSPVLERMFEADMREASEAVIEFPDVAPEAVEALLHYMYTSRRPDPSGGVDVLPDLHSLAQRYQICDLAEETGWEMMQGLSPENVFLRARALRLHAESREAGHFWGGMMEIMKAEGNEAIFKAFVEGALDSRQ